MSAPPAASERPPAPAKPPRRPGDVVFSGLSTASAFSILLILAGVAIFLISKALPVFGADPAEVTGGEGFLSYVWPLVFGTLVASLIAMLVATPVAVGIALFVSHYAPKRLGTAVGFVIDLLAAVPSVVFGMWGFQVFAPKLVPLFGWLEEHLGFLPFFESASRTGRTLLTASLVLAVMILPIVTSVSREVFLQTPRLHEEAALALGATQWEMIRTAVLPFGRPGVIGGTMLGLGRALGETMAVAIILSPGVFTWNLIDTGNTTVPAEIALNFPEAAGLRLSELIAAGLVLFGITLAVNLAARAVVERRAEFSGAN
ncbi:phosphate ABC transporter permease subunit PstC [Phycicoccus endophyticus]|uniref:Phosphate transport system permease protein n=1 Tax=Phycicoccus endophyticus TaxID=1690220 RepID=A0A7G9R1U6_9MICO|nr:phosphate ABC transporter permease subunit PstC [Phycicoccus endophyticus]NHI18631.1 phosphate ABC transporter permease subunit PstC [Phycicoccus endophyticus]QNN49571.1 phosphate ABC transporter permease subunit PstC [Phycicoccus endophyticus]GGL37665.1 phosphate transport system permease protein [Phycicoccus endophyticus]